MSVITTPPVPFARAPDEASGTRASWSSPEMDTKPCTAQTFRNKSNAASRSAAQFAGMAQRRLGPHGDGGLSEFSSRSILARHLAGCLNPSRQGGGTAEMAL